MAGGSLATTLGPATIRVRFDDTVRGQNAICGLDVWGRMSFKILGPDAPKPLVARADQG